MKKLEWTDYAGLCEFIRGKSVIEDDIKWASGADGLFAHAVDDNCYFQFKAHPVNKYWRLLEWNGHAFVRVHHSPEFSTLDEAKAWLEVTLALDGRLSDGE